MIERHLDNVEEETKFEMLQIAFNSLKERCVIKKFSKISSNCYNLKMKRKIFFTLQ